jgi:protein-disulfide isomerase
MSNDETALAEPIGPRDHVQGPADAPVTLVEYGDYECPYCGEAYPVLKEVQKKMGNNLRFVFRNFPLTQSHPYAFPAAEAAEAAGAQGKFWEMHDILYDHQQNLEPQELVSYAWMLKLDMERFVNNVNTSMFATKIKHDFQTGVMSGVNGTPSLFINGERYDGSFDAETLLEVFQAVAIESGSSHTKVIRP